MKEFFNNIILKTFMLVMVASAAVTVNNIIIKADDVPEVYTLSDSDLAVEGFQIRAAAPDIESGTTVVGFRAVMKAPKIGSVITVADQDMTVLNYGTIYVIDANKDGLMDGGDAIPRAYSKDYTVLDRDNGATTTSVAGSSLTTYRGIIDKAHTVGYINSENAVLPGYNIEDTTHDYYATTMLSRESDSSLWIIPHYMQVRPFIVAEDSEHNTHFVYGYYSYTTSVARISYNVYKSGKVSNYNVYNYIYNKILHSDLLRTEFEKNNTYKYYLSAPLEYGWSDNLYDTDGTDADSGQEMDPVGEP
ncbi:MAG: hypothetical protein K6G88_01000 [Lachnospiraceae bacterium]|nr:hypothetical protein [Lachnospiraceae bacterium]